MNHSTAQLPWNLALIGAQATIIASRNSTLVGIFGTIIDETKNTFTIQLQDNQLQHNQAGQKLEKNHSEKKTKKIIKHTVTLQIGQTIIPSTRLVGTIQERIKATKFHNSSVHNT